MDFSMYISFTYLSYKVKYIFYWWAQGEKMYKISKVAMLSVLLLAFGCTKKNIHNRTTVSTDSAILESKLDTHSCCEKAIAGVIHFEFDKSDVLPLRTLYLSSHCFDI